MALMWRTAGLHSRAVDLPNCLTHSSASLFADDTNVTAEGISIGEIEDKLCIDLEPVCTSGCWPIN